MCIYVCVCLFLREYFLLTCFSSVPHDCVSHTVCVAAVWSIKQAHFDIFESGLSRNDECFKSFFCLMTAWHFVSMRLTFRNRSFLPGFTSTVITDRASDMLAKVIVGRRILPAPCPLTVTMAQPCHSLRYCQQSMPTLDCQGAWCHRLRRLHCTMAGNPHDDSDGTCHDGAEYSASVADSEAGREHATGVASTSEVVDGILRKLSDRELNEINPSLSQVGAGSYW